MQDYDAALKLLLRQAAGTAIRMLSGVSISKWLDIELPKAQNLRMDLLGEDAKGELHHFELQSTNDMRIDLRMAEYALGTRRLTGKFANQTVLYVGQAPLRMPSELRGPNILIIYRLIDMRDLDGDELLASPEVGDNVIAILARLRDDKQAVRSIVKKIATLAAGDRNTAIQQLFMLAGLRRLEQTVKEEVEHMPLEIDLMENEVLGPAIRQGLEQGLQQGLRQGVKQGLQQGVKQGRVEGELRLLRLQIEKRFGRIPEWGNRRLAGLSIAEIEALAERIFDAPTIESLLN